MTLSDFRQSTENSQPPADISAALLALWHDARGDWALAHGVAQDVNDADGAWVHAYLHRKEGDHGNAAYWYRRAGKPTSHESLEHEWDRIAATLLGLI
jgi:hypothetical protein